MVDSPENNNTNAGLAFPDYNNILPNTNSFVDNTGITPNLSEYNFNYRVFPEDLGTSYNSHYMVININIPVNSSGQKRTNLSDLPNDTGIAIGDPSTEWSKVDKLRFGVGSGQFGGVKFSSNPIDTNYALSRGTRRIKEAIAIHMPTPMIYNSSHIFEEISLTAIAGQIGKLGAGAIGGALGTIIARSVQGGLNAGSALRGLYGLGQQIIGTASTLMGSPINPRVEVLFSHTPQRQFTFEILMAPRNENESRTMKSIVNTLRYHAAPEIGNSLTIGSILGPLSPTLASTANSLGISNVGIPTFIPPAEFDITFYHNGVENTNIPRINTCVLERIEVDYAPTGVYSTFRNGHPVTARLSLAFRETEILHKQRIAQGF